MKIRKLLTYFIVIAIIAYTIWVVFFRFDPDLENALSSLGLIVINFLVAVIGFVIFRQKSFDNRICRGWLFLGLAAISNAIAECLWFYYDMVLGVSPFPSLADFFYLLFYPLTLTGVLLLPYKRVKRMEYYTYLFDLSIVMVTLVMIFWYFILVPTHLLSEGGLEGILAIAYPVGDLLLLSGIITLFQRNTEKISKWVLIFLSLSMLVTAIPDTIFAYYELNDIPYSMAYMNIFWLLSPVFVMIAGNKQLDTISTELNYSSKISERSQRLFRTTLPYAAAATGPTLLVRVINSSMLTGLQLQGLLIGVVLLVILVLGRQHIVLMDNIQLYEETHKLAIMDSLTNVYNRHFLNEVLKKEIERSDRYKKPFSVLLIDVDNFKAINDTYGHLKGDSVLKIIAGLLSEQVRQSDILARFGGDEFVIILLESELEGAKKVAQKIELYVAAHSFANDPLSVSIGAASYKPGLSAEQLLEEADKQLYKNKQLKNSLHIIPASLLYY